MPEGQGYGPPIQRARLPDGRTALRDAEGNTWVLDESLIETTGRGRNPSGGPSGPGAGMLQAANLAFGPETQTVGTVLGLAGGPIAGARAALGAGVGALTGGAAKGMLPAVGQRLVRGGVGAGVGSGIAALPGVPGTPEQGALLGFGVGSGFAPGGIGPLFRHGMKVRGIRGGTKLLARLLGLGDEVAPGAGVRKHTGPGFLESIFGGADEAAGLPPGASTTQGAGRAGQIAQQVDEARQVQTAANALGRGGSRATSTLGPQAGLPSPPLNPQQAAAAEAAMAARAGRAAVPPGPVGAPGPVGPAPAPAPPMIGAPGAARVAPTGPSALESQLQASVQAGRVPPAPSVGGVSIDPAAVVRGRALAAQTPGGLPISGAPPGSPQQIAAKLQQIADPAQLRELVRQLPPAMRIEVERLLRGAQSGMPTTY